MADIEDLYDDEDGTPADNRGDINKALHEVRKENKDLKKQLGELEDLRAFKVSAEKAARETAVADAFRQMGLNPKHARFYDGEDTSADAIKAWAVAEDFLAQAEEEEETTKVVTSDAGFSPTAVGQGAPLGSKRYSFEEWEGLLRSDPNRAMEVWNAGRVERDTSPGGTVFAGRDR